jgi:hypothetical protein
MTTPPVAGGIPCHSGSFRRARNRRPRGAHMAGARLSVRRRHGRTLPSAPAPVDSAGERTRYAGAPPGGFGAALPQAEPLAGTLPAYGCLSRWSRCRVSRNTRPMKCPMRGDNRDITRRPPSHASERAGRQLLRSCPGRAARVSRRRRLAPASVAKRQHERDDQVSTMRSAPGIRRRRLQRGTSREAGRPRRRR